MNRREFIELAGAGMAASLAKPSFAVLLHPEKQAFAKPYGSGHFGHWFTDERGLPAYRYTANQLTDPAAVTLTHPDILGATGHLHLVGNDRIVGVASNFGYIQVRQDEGAPKYLNDYAPAAGLYGAGIGWLTDGSETLSTYYSASNPIERIFGQGYFRKIARSAKYAVEQTVFAPYGDDPVLISLVKITNHGQESTMPRWLEYWGASNFQFSYRARLQADASKGTAKFIPLRRQFARRFEHTFELASSGRGLLERQRFLGREPEDEALWEKVKAAKLATEPAPGAAYDDLNPPPTFLVSLDGPVDGFTTNAVAFFGKGGMLQPDGLREKLNGSLSAKGPESAHILERALTLAPGESRTIALMYGYLPEGFSVDMLIARYPNPEQAFAGSCAKWKNEGIRFHTSAEPWVQREVAWHNYYLRGALTYDSFFREHIISQGCVYQHVMGFQGAARDPLQHVLPFLFSDPGLVRQHIRYTLKEIQPDSSLPYALVGAGVPMPSEFLPSDQEMWLLWVLAEYVLATRDRAFLEEKIPLYPRHEVHPTDPTVGELAMRLFRHFVDVIGVGEHGLARVMMGDWNDGIVLALVPNDHKAEVGEKGESALNAAMACYVLGYYGQMLAFTGNAKAAEEAHARAEAQRKALRAQWAGRWFKRAWLGPHLETSNEGWLGVGHLWLEPQPWAILGGAATAEQTAALIRAIDEEMRRPSPIGAIIQSRPTPGMSNSPGIQENGGVWPSINGTLIWALAAHDGAMAWDEWKKNSLAAHAEAYPNIWYGIWSGPDTFNSIYSDHPGETQLCDPHSANPKEREDWGFSWTDFPVMCQHQHAWPLYTAAKLLGLEFHERGLTLAPSLPLEEFSFESTLLGLKKEKTGYTGWYAPQQPGTWEIEIHLPNADRAKLTTIKVNGTPRPVPREIVPIKLKGESQSGQPLRWELNWA